LGKARPSELIAQAGFEQPRGIVLLAAAAVVDPDVANGRNQFESFVEWERQPDFAECRKIRRVAAVAAERRATGRDVLFPTPWKRLKGANALMFNQ
jgi:hypothetical protein